MVRPRLKDNKTFLIVFALILLVLAAHGRALNAGYVWDDESLLTANRHVKSPDGLKTIWLSPRDTGQYYPLTFTSFWLQHRLWGLDPMPYHAANILLHLGSTLLVWRILVFLGVPGAAFAALLFGVHPVHVESVAWIAERKNVLSGFFYLGSLFLFLKFACSAGMTGLRRWSVYAASTLIFLAAVLSKSVTCTLPFTAMLLVWFKVGRLRARSVVLPLLPWIAAGAALGFLTLILERDVIGATGADWSYNLWERCLIAAGALWFYLGKLAWPFHLSFFYPRWHISAGSPELIACFVAAVGVALLLWLKRRAWGRGPRTAAVFFAMTLFPALGFFDIYPMMFSLVADHFQYLASLGPIALFAALGMRWGARFGKERVLHVMCPAAAVFLAVSSWQQAGVYRDHETLYRDVLKKNPGCWVAHSNLGAHLGFAGKHLEAEGHFEEAVRLNPDYAEGWHNLGKAAEQSGGTKEAESRYRRALEADPDFLKSHYALGKLLILKGLLREAESHLEKALSINPYHARARAQLGTVHLMRGHLHEAVSETRRALEVKEDFPEARYNLGLAYSKLGRKAEAETQLLEALRLKPDLNRARQALAELYLDADNPERAKAVLLESLAYEVKDAGVWVRLGDIALSLARPEEGARYYRMALQLRPDHAGAQSGLKRIEGP